MFTLQNKAVILWKKGLFQTWRLLIRKRLYTTETKSTPPQNPSNSSSSRSSTSNNISQSSTTQKSSQEQVKADSPAASTQQQQPPKATQQSSLNVTPSSKTSTTSIPASAPQKTVPQNRPKRPIRNIVIFALLVGVPTTVWLYSTEIKQKYRATKRKYVDPVTLSINKLFRKKERESSEGPEIVTVEETKKSTTSKQRPERPEKEETNISRWERETPSSTTSTPTTTTTTVVSTRDVVSVPTLTSVSMSDSVSGTAFSPSSISTSPVSPSAASHESLPKQKNETEVTDLKRDHSVDEHHHSVPAVTSHPETTTSEHHTAMSSEKRQESPEQTPSVEVEKSSETSLSTNSPSLPSSSLSSSSSVTESSSAPSSASTLPPPSHSEGLPTSSPTKDTTIITTTGITQTTLEEFKPHPTAASSPSPTSTEKEQSSVKDSTLEELKAMLNVLQQKLGDLENLKQQMSQMTQNVRDSEPQLLRELIERLKVEKEEIQNSVEQKLAAQRAELQQKYESEFEKAFQTVEHSVSVTIQQLQDEYARQHTLRMQHIQKLKEQIVDIGESVLETYREYDVQSQRIHQLSLILVNLHNKILDHRPFLEELRSLKAAVQNNELMSIAVSAIPEDIAKSGLMSVSELQAEFQKILRQSKRAALGNGIYARIVESLYWHMKRHSVDEYPAGNDAWSIVTRADYELRHGNVLATVKELENLSRGIDTNNGNLKIDEAERNKKVAEVTQNWLKLAKIYISTLQALRILDTTTTALTAQLLNSSPFRDRTATQ